MTRRNAAVIVTGCGTADGHGGSAKSRNKGQNLVGINNLPSTAVDKASEAGHAVADAAQAAASSAVNAVEKVTGMDLNSDGSIGEKAAEVAKAADAAELPKDDKTV